MNCRRIHKRLSAYVDGELPGDLAERVRLHLDKCPRCRHAHHLLVALDARIEPIPAPRLVSPENFTLSVMKQIRALPDIAPAVRPAWVPSVVYAGLFAIFLWAGFLFLPHPAAGPDADATTPAWSQILEEDAALHLSQLQDPQIATLWSEVHETAE